ncbi:high-affinity nicotinic acid transporter [Ilyonectria sp. MPI-CAGE-AT-0026]|nr:high-affinity nicotinic acid transporter [Ilyonectria sp. MPI-CAGE-AT-0026]
MRCENPELYPRSQLSDLSKSGTWSVAQVQALTVPCYALGAITYLVTAWLSDRSQRRTRYVVILGLVSAAGYGILISPAPGGVKYFGCCIVAIGLYAIVGIPMSWLPSNNLRYGKRTVATGLQVTIGNMSGILAPFLYSSADGPRFTLGHSVSLAMIVIALMLFWAMGLWFRNVNRRRAAGKEDHRVENLSQEEIRELGEYDPDYRYTY